MTRSARCSHKETLGSINEGCWSVEVRGSDVIPDGIKPMIREIGPAAQLHSHARAKTTVLVRATQRADDATAVLIKGSRAVPGGNAVQRNRPSWMSRAIKCIRAGHNPTFVSSRSEVDRRDVTQRGCNVVQSPCERLSGSADQRWNPNCHQGRCTDGFGRLVESERNVAKSAKGRHSERAARVLVQS